MNIKNLAILSVLILTMCAFCPAPSYNAMVEVPIEIEGKEKLKSNQEFRAILRNTDDSSMVSMSKFDIIPKKGKKGTTLKIGIKDLNPGKYLVEGYVVEIITTPEDEKVEMRSAYHDSAWTEIDLSELGMASEDNNEQIFSCQPLVISKRKTPKYTTKFTFTL